jgi:hypothetical protein
MRLSVLVGLCLLAAAPVVGGAEELRPASAFAGIADPAQRGAALFTEASKVLLHPRCLNCHPDGDAPTQGLELQPHDPPVQRGTDGHGSAALRCSSCHPAENYAPAHMPGNPKWGLAGIEMAWQGRSPAAICAQLKDPARNGGHSLAEIVDHAAEDVLVAWGWAPGDGREPAPGTQAGFGELMRAWVASGAACPAD